MIIAALALIFTLAPVQAQVGKSLGVLDANRATEQELMAVPHMNAALVKAIIDKRPFANVTELAAVLSPAVSASQLTEVYGKLFVHINLNTATDDEIRSIPAAQPARVLREFKEYRPWRSIEQFRREIGKYVNAKELARLERYVKIAQAGG
jgi:DNA uptake protein ComE-like DNA-binding protein